MQAPARKRRVWRELFELAWLLFALLLLIVALGLWLADRDEEREARRAGIPQLER
jgi:cytochrome oxidase assembly protein ShyY1